MVWITVPNKYEHNGCLYIPNCICLKITMAGRFFKNYFTRSYYI